MTRAVDSNPIYLSLASLVQRVEDLQRLPRDWRKRLCVVKDALKAAYCNLNPAVAASAAQVQSSPPAGDGKELLNYFLAVAVFDQLKPGANKNVLGWFQGEAGTWEKIVAAYCKSGLWVGEAAQYLQWFAEHEMPRLRSEANALRKTLQALERRHEEAMKSCHAAAGRYRRECSQLHLLGENLKAELQAAVLQLPEKLQSSIQALQRSKLKDIAQVYAQQADECSDSSCQPLPALRAVLSDTCQPADVPKLEHMWAAHDDKRMDCTNDDSPHNLQIREVELELSSPAATHDRSELNTWGIAAVQEGSWNSKTPVVSEETNAACVDIVGQEMSDGASGQQPCQQEAAAAAARVAFDDDFRAQIMADLYEMQAYCCRIVEEGEAPEPIAAVFGTLLQKGEAMVAVEDAKDAMSAISLMFDTLQGRPGVQMALRALTSRVFAARLLRQLTLGKNQECKYKEAGEEALLRQQEEQRKLAAIISQQNECMQYIEWLSTQVEQHLAARVGRRVVLPPELLF